ncbi:MAG: hypothetical protein ACLKAK_13070 [Alkaliphilus sp.]
MDYIVEPQNALGGYFDCFIDCLIEICVDICGIDCGDLNCGLDCPTLCGADVRPIGVGENK